MPGPESIVILCAMPIEAKAIPEGWKTLVTGPGFRAAASATEALLRQQRPGGVISAGTCGALDPALRVGEVLVAGRVRNEEEELTPSLLQGETVLWSQDRVAVRVADKAALFARGARIVDMEAMVVGRLCQQAGVPFGCVKAVSDTATEDLPIDFNQYRDEQGQFQRSRIAIAGIMKLPGLLRLKRNTELAVRNLGVAIERILSERT